MLTFSVAEHLLWGYLGLPQFEWLWMFGLGLSLAGYGLRLMAFLSAGSNFTHKVAY